VPTLNEILEHKAKRKKKLEISLKSLINQLKELDALKIILFGSLVDGNVDVNSDLDLLVIMPTRLKGKEWLNLIYDKIERNIASDIIVYNTEEFNSNLPKSSFLNNIISTGKIVYEKTK